MTQPEPAPSLPRDNRLTIHDYVHLPDDGKRYEILDGELAVTPAPTTRHQKISRLLQFVLMRELEMKGLGEVYDAPVDVILDDYHLVQPDLAFVRAERSELIEEHAIVGPPDLIVEILSPSTRRRDILVKAKTYARFGVEHYWIVDPVIDRIEFHRAEDGAYQLLESVSAPDVARPAGFDGLELPLAEIFA